MNVPEARSSEVETMLTKRKPSAASSARRQKLAATESRHTPSPAQAGPREPSSTLSHRREPSSMLDRRREPWTGLEDEVKRLRAEVQQRERLGMVLEGLLESLCDGTVALDFRGMLVHVSDSLVESSIDGLPGLPAPVLERLREEGAAIVDGRPRRFELIWDREDLGRRVYEVAVATGRALDQGDRPFLTVFAFHDRTRMVELEGELERARDLAALGRMAATVAHEVRNPLAGIQGFATLLRRDLHDRPELQTQVDRILLGVDGANRIVADLLEYSRPLTLHKESISLEALLAESLAAAQISKRWTPQLQIDVDVDPVLPVCVGDRRLLLQVLNNLYDNAIDAMGGSGCLSVRARSAGGVGGERIRIVVRDSGCGLTAEEVARVFEPFYTSKPGGTGLGLAIVRRVVEAHRGHVHVVSAPGKGTSVVLELPVERRSEPIERSGRSTGPVSEREAA